MSLIDAIPQTIKQIGAAKARGAAGTGQAWGQSIADIGQAISAIPEQRRRERSLAMAEQINEMRLNQAKREEAASVAIQNATAAALNPDGTVDAAKLTQHLAGTPAASQLPVILDQFNKLAQSKYDLQGKAVDAAAAEADALGALAHAAAQAEHPEDQAGLLATGIASGIKTGTIKAETGNKLLSDVLGDDGSPNPEKVSEAIKRLQAGSKEQRTLAATDAQRAAATESANALAAERKGKTERDAFNARLTNISRQLAGTNNKAQYARVYAGVPDELKNYFDAPEDWTADSATNASDVLMSPDAAAARRESRRHNLVLEKQGDTRNAIARSREGRLASGAGADDKVEKDRYQKYKDFASAYEKAQDEARMRAPEKIDKDFGTPIGKDVPAYLPAPSYEKWKAMTPAERAKVLSQPDARIDDAEMARRLSGGTPNTPTSAAPVPAAPAATPPKAGAKPAVQVGQVVTVRGKRVKVTAINPDGSITGDVLP